MIWCIWTVVGEKIRWSTPHHPIPTLNHIHTFLVDTAREDAPLALYGRCVSSWLCIFEVVDEIVRSNWQTNGRTPPSPTFTHMHIHTFLCRTSCLTTALPLESVGNVAKSVLNIGSRSGLVVIEPAPPPTSLPQLLMIPLQSSLMSMFTCSLRISAVMWLEF